MRGDSFHLIIYGSKKNKIVIFVEIYKIDKKCHSNVS